jgi:hypothetical protein
MAEEIIDFFYNGNKVYIFRNYILKLIFKFFLIFFFLGTDSLIPIINMIHILLEWVLEIIGMIFILKKFYLKILFLMTVFLKMTGTMVKYFGMVNYNIFLNIDCEN